MIRPVSRVRARGAAALLLGSLSFASCQRGKDADLVVNRRLEGEPRTLNALLATSDTENVVLGLVARGLLDYDEKLDLVPGLAESVTADAAHLVYTVTLRKGLRWEDGAPITSEDVAFTILTLVDPKVPALNRRSLFESFEKVETPDDRTARVIFSKPYAGRLNAFNLPLLPARVYRGTDVLANRANRAPVASGPYRLAAWETGREIRLVRNTQYFGAPAPAEQFVFRVVPESATAFQALAVGEIDEMRLSAAQRNDVLGGKVKARVLTFDELAYTFIAWNNRHPAFSDPRVRRALTMLADREAIARTLYGGLAKAANGPIPPGLWPYDPTLAPWPYDPAGAGRLLDAAGWRKGADGVRARDGKRFAFRLSLGAGSDRQRQIVEVLQQAYRTAGVEMTIEPLEWGTFTDKVDKGDYEAASLAMGLDPNPDLAPSFHSSQAPPAGMNHAFYRNPRADALMDELRTTFDRARARALYHELERVIHEDEPFTFLHFVSVSWGVANRIEDVHTSPIGLSTFWPGAAGWVPSRGKRPI